jgi:AbrB family looped-hinge helix DNA binding protein
MATATLSSKGQLVVPKAIRDALGLKPGSEVDFVVLDSGDVVLRPAVEDVRGLKGLLRRFARTPLSIDEMDEAIRRRAGG